MNYPIASFLTQIKNAYMARKKVVVFPHSKMIEAIGNILVKEKFVKSIKITEDGVKKNVEVGLLYHSHEPALSEVKIVSKPSIHTYAKKDDVRHGINRFKTNILSTNQGVMTAKDAMKKKIGGEVLCTIS